MSALALCQDCLRPHLFANYREASDDEARCSCGGEVCPCNACRRTVGLLQDGFTSKEVLGLSCDIVSWDDQRGAVFVGEAA